MECDCLPACPFFNGRMQNMPTMSEMLKQRFCRGEPDACARCMVVKTLGRAAVPFDLFPDEAERARELIDSAEKPADR